MNKTIIALLVVLVAGLGVFGYKHYASVKEGGMVYCTMEAKLCPDGSYVGRHGPKCEFDACPAATTSTSTTATTTGGNPGIVAYKSGVKGTIMVGPTCPVERMPPDPNCADKPLSTLVAIFRASDKVHAVAIFQSDKEGKFSASLPPGDYVIGAGENKMPTCPQTPVTVKPSGYIEVTVSCDSGIR